MLIDSPYASLHVEAGGHARLVGACDARLICLQGEAWITIDGDRRDIVLEAGEHFVVDSNAAVMVTALRKGSPLELAVDAERSAPCASRVQRRPHLMHGLVQLFTPRTATQIAIV